MGWSNGGPVFFSGPKGGPEYFEGQRGGPEFFLHMRRGDQKQLATGHHKLLLNDDSYLMNLESWTRLSYFSLFMNNMIKGFHVSVNKTNVGLATNVLMFKYVPAVNKHKHKFHFWCFERVKCVFEYYVNVHIHIIVCELCHS